MNLPLDKIRTDAGTQARAVINSETVADYAEAMTEGAKFPPVIVFHDGTDYFLADGFHRVMAACRLGFKEIVCDVRKGTREDALWFAIGANRTNGQRMNRADVRHAIAVAINAWRERKQSEIARQIGCSISLVNDVKQELFAREKLTIPATRIGADGKARPTTYAHREPAEREPPEAAEAGRAPPEPTEPEPVEIDAMMIAEKAIFYMTQIGPRMKRRDEAMQRVIAWCKARQREWRKGA